MNKYFVWTFSQKGPQPQLWMTEPVDGNGKPIKEALFKQKLTEEEELLSFDELILKFEKNKPSYAS